VKREPAGSSVTCGVSFIYLSSQAPGQNRPPEMRRVR
jgi:hypothetical protein